MNTRTLKTVRVISGVIALIGAAASYRTQILDLLRWGVDHPPAIAIPATVDLLGIICALVLHTPGVDPAGRRVAGWVLALTCVVSMTANALGGDTWGSRIAHMWCVLAYLAAEAVSAKAKTKAGTADPQLAAAQAELTATREQLAAATSALTEAQAAVEQVRTDAARTVRAERTKARKAIREAQGAVQGEPAAPVQTAPVSKLWIPSSPADLEAIYLPDAPVSPAPAMG